MTVPLKFEVFYSGQWNDWTERARGAPSPDGRIDIQRGRRDWLAGLTFSTCRMSINNQDGLFSPRNPTSPLYGLIGRNTPVRVTVDSPDIAEVDRVRFVGEVSQWPQRWITDAAAWVPIEASGIVRRLRRPHKALHDTLHRWVEQVAAPPAAYWPLSDPELSSIGRPVIGAHPWRPFGGSTRFGSQLLAQWLGTGAAIVEAQGTMLGNVSMAQAPDRVVVEHMRRADDGGTGPSVLDIRGNTEDGGCHWIITFTPPDTVEIQLNVDGVFVFTDSATFEPLFSGDPHHVRFQAFQGGGSNIDWVLFVDGVTAISGTESSQDLSGVGQVRMSYTPGSQRAPLVFGHLAVWDNAAPPLLLTLAAYRGHVGETAGRRIERICDEEGIPLVTVGNLDDTASMGPQRPRTTLELIVEAAEADQGILYEPRDQLGLAYRTLRSLYNQDPTAELSYRRTNGTGDVFEPFQPTEDDQATANDVTVRRLDGGEHQAVRQSGPLSVQDPPDGVGRYDSSATVNVVSDALLPDHAGWRLHLGTVDEARWPQVGVNLARLLRDGRESIAAAVAALEPGDRLTVDNLPADIAVDLVDQITQGYRETLDSEVWRWAGNHTPARPFVVGVWVEDDSTPDPDAPSRWSPEDSRVQSEFVAGTDTALSVEDQTGHDLWSTSAALPFDIITSGVRLRVTAIGAATGSVQTMTVQQTPVNGVAKTIPAGSQVSLWTPARWAL